MEFTWLHISSFLHSFTNIPIFNCIYKGDLFCILTSYIGSRQCSKHLNYIYEKNSPRGFTQYLS